MSARKLDISHFIIFSFYAICVITLFSIDIILLFKYPIEYVWKICFVVIPFIISLFSCTFLPLAKSRIKPWLDKKFKKEE